MITSRRYFLSTSKLILTFLITYTISFSQTIVYVNDNATGSPANGTSWAQAYRDLNHALTAHQNTAGGVQIWVASGVYYPTTTTNRNISFQISRANLTIAGGFDGTETSFSQRNTVSNVAILSGNIGSTATNTDNSHVVVFVNNVNVNTSTHLMGLRISDGNGTIPGAGMQVSGGYLSITDCMFYNNRSTDDGGAVCLTGSTGYTNQNIFSRCIFRDNFSNANGGGCVSFANRSSKFMNCLFYNNIGVNGGGGLAVMSSHSEVINCTFAQNECTTASGLGIYKGGAILFYLGGSSMTHSLINSIIVGNTPYSSANPTQVVRPINWGTYTHNLFEGPGYGLNVLTFNPSLPLFGTTSGPFSIDKFCSQAYNAGTTFTGLASSTDLLGNPRSSRGRIDLGSYEFTFNENSSVTGLITCSGFSTGAITLPFAGANAEYYVESSPFSSWVNSSLARTQNGFPSGKYYTGIKQNGCTSVTLLDSATITDAPVLSFTGIIKQITCNGAANAQVQVSSIVGGFGASQRGVRVNGGSNWFVPNTFTGIGAGITTVTVSQIGCARNYFYTITQPGAINPQILGSWDVLCNGQNNGYIQFLPIGGVPPYLYSISGVSASANTISGGSLQISNLTPGSKILTIRDANRCTVNSFNFTINQPAPISPALVLRKHISCNGLNDGLLVATATGGSSSLYSYALTTFVGAPVISSNSITGLNPGTYSIIIKDLRNCSNILSGILITTPSLLVASRVITNNLCSGLNQASVTVSGTGGTPPYQYSFDASPFQSSRVFGNQFQGSYVVHVKDANNCTAATSAQLVDPLPFGITEQGIAPTCNGNTDGKLLVTLTGGTGTLSATVNGAWFNGNFTATGLTALQQYQIRIQDQNGCLDFYNTQVPDKAAITLTGSVTKATCTPANDWSVALNASGGNGGFTYKFDNGNFTSANFIDNLSPSTVLGFAQDSKGCVSTVTSIVAPSASPLTASLLSKTDVLCFGATTGAISLNVSGGSSPYIYSINNSAFNNSSILSNLGAGTKEVLVKDQSNCIVTVSGITISQPISDIISSAEVENNTNIKVTASGGTGTLSYSLNGGVAQAENLFTNLTSGSYTIKITDANGCFKTIQQDVNIPNTTLPSSINSSLLNEINIYPNPASGTFIIANASIGSTVEIWNAQGVLVFSQISTTEPATLVTKLPSGIYTVKVANHTARLVLY